MTDDFLTAFRGSFTSTLRWHHLDALWSRLRESEGEWYVYAVGETPPEKPLNRDDFMVFLNEMDRLLREDHQEDYCGIVYANSLEQPTMVKIYDPHNLGVVCGYSENPPLPGWVISRLKPCDLPAAQAQTKQRRHWWDRLFAS